MIRGHLITNFPNVMVLLIVYNNDNIQGQPNESQSLKSNQTFHFEAERYYFNWI